MNVNPKVRTGVRADRKGATVLMMVLLLVILLGMVAFAVDVGRLYLVRSQLQSAVDAGALAAGLQLAEDPDNIDAAVEAGKKFVQLNRVGALVMVPEDSIIIEPGKWDPDDRVFSRATLTPDAIQVTARVDKEPFFFGGLLGLNEFAVPRGAIAQGGGAPLDIIMTLDLSGSMESQGRIEALRDAAPEFVDVIEAVGDDDRIGVFGYGAIPDEYDPEARGHSGASYLLAPQSLYPPDDTWCGVKEAELTVDFEFLRNQVLDSQSLVANKYNGWTPVGAAIRDSAHYLSNNAREKVEQVIVLMSDGHANKPDRNGPGYALEMAQRAADMEIRIYTISLGDGADEDLMQSIADTTGGEHFIASADSTTDLSAALTEAFRRIATSIKKSQLVQ